MKPDWLDYRSMVEKAIAGAIQSGIDAHGPITKFNKGSTAKRVYCQLKALREESYDRS